jgi:pimeloyl-ACP methyl ester carboxylesterase
MAVEVVDYDEFGLFHENAAEYGIPYDGPPVVRRENIDLGDGRHLSALVWGDAPPELVFFHGGAQNAHTWDTVALALGRSMVCLDLQGHGHSGPPADATTDTDRNAEDLALVVRALAPEAAAVIGMSLGGLTMLALADHAPELVRKAVLVDITPGVDAKKTEQITAFVNGPESFPSFEELLKRTVEFNSTRTVESLRRGILHNAEQREDGGWVWRYARFRGTEANGFPQFARLWDIISNLTVPLMLARGMREQSVVDDKDEAELLTRYPSTRVEHIADAGHSIQGDAPIELARLIEDFVFGPTS